MDEIRRSRGNKRENGVKRGQEWGEVKEDVKEERESVGSVRSRRRKRIRICLAVKIVLEVMCAQQTRRQFSEPNGKKHPPNLICS